MAVSHVNDANFTEEIENHTGVSVVDFYADWCAPCRFMTPVMEQLATEYEGEVKFVKIDVDDARNTAMQFGIRAIPTLIIFKDGKEVERMMGAQSGDRIKALVDNLK